MAWYLPSDESRVLVIYTGGTIGMLVGPKGYRNEPQFLTETLRCQTRFHDPLEASLFSHADSIDKYRKWSSLSSGRSSPDTTPSRTPSDHIRTLLVRSSQPIGAVASLSPSDHAQNAPSTPACRKISDNVYEADVESLVTPRSSLHGTPGKRIRYAILEVSSRALRTFNPTKPY